MAHLTAVSTPPIKRVASLQRLNRLKSSGVFNNIISLGYIFNEGCGRFLSYKCTCNKCMQLQVNNKVIKDIY